MSSTKIGMSTTIEPLIGGLIHSRATVSVSSYPILTIEPLIGGLILTISSALMPLKAIEPLIGGLILALQARCRCLQLPIEPLIGGLIRVEKWRSTVVYLY